MKGRTREFFTLHTTLAVSLISPGAETARLTIPRLIKTEVEGRLSDHPNALLRRSGMLGVYGRLGTARRACDPQLRLNEEDGGGGGAS